ncbi:hypothetical protein F5Y04DRAFT_252628 [Hypomontagnella monticulosa]|nr:hypothetical protein F5Y04DRAFT_252628 [Hypomontagnella monticulosa]
MAEERCQDRSCCETTLHPSSKAKEHPTNTNISEQAGSAPSEPSSTPGEPSSLGQYRQKPNMYECSQREGERFVRCPTGTSPEEQAEHNNPDPRGTTHESARGYPRQKEKTEQLSPGGDFSASIKEHETATWIASLQEAHSPTLNADTRTSVMGVYKVNIPVTLGRDTNQPTLPHDAWKVFSQIPIENFASTSTKQPITDSIGNERLKDVLNIELPGAVGVDDPISYDSSISCGEPIIGSPSSGASLGFDLSPEDNPDFFKSAIEHPSMYPSDCDGTRTCIEHDALCSLKSSILEELLDEFFHGYSPSQRVYTETIQAGNTTSHQHSYTLEQARGGIGGKDINSYGRHKRKRQEKDRRYGEDEGDGDKSPSSRSSIRPSTETEPLFWACPFSKWKPLAYRKCYQYILKDISRVKQHLRRHHERPPYCPVCWEIFREGRAFEYHIQCRECSPRPKVDIEGVNTDQQKQLEARPSRQLSKPEQWYAIYETLFPGQPHPSTPYIESDISAELLSFEKFMATEGLEIVKQKTREHIPPNLIPLEDEVSAFSEFLFQQAIPEILRRYDTTRPTSLSPEISREPGSLGLSTHDSESGHGTFSQASGDRRSGYDDGSVCRTTDSTIASSINVSHCQPIAVMGTQERISPTETQIMTSPAQSLSLSTMQIASESLPPTTINSESHNALPKSTALGVEEHPPPYGTSYNPTWLADSTHPNSECFETGLEKRPDERTFTALMSYPFESSYIDNEQLLNAINLDELFWEAEHDIADSAT